MHLWKGEDGANLCISSVPHEPRTRPEDRLWEASQETSLPCRGDQILEADSVSLRHAAFSEAYGILGECGPGPVSLITSQHPNAKGSMGKMAVADEITTINRIPVSKMTYEEICLLRQCVPTSVTLQIQKASSEEQMDAGSSDGDMKCCESSEEEGSLHCKRISFCSAGNVNGLKDDLLEKEGCHDEQRSKSESKMAIDDCSPAVKLLLSEERNQQFVQLV
ncbi:hypothetical protein Q9966_005900 [Columba livia]|nr:hypothetical protein Q9966_005897 [Columba livia]KAK2537194.1 hypothetical protein Q9966_005899 [Columba livia]KAK2537195.1 hypothetical protein Q9966_005900 [Columba livia]